MILAALLLVTLAVAAGAGLALWHLRAGEGGIGRPPGWAGVSHGLIGATGLAVLLFALRGPAHGVAAGAGSFGVLAAALFATALAAGLIIPARRRKPASVLIAIHSGLAITGYLLLLAWYSLG